MQSWSVWAELLLLGVCLGVIFFSFPLLLREDCHSMWVLRGLPCGIGWIGAGCHRGVMCTFLLTLQGQPYVGAGGGPFQLPPLSTLLSKQEQAIQTHTPNGRLAGRVLLRATSCVCVCVCVLLGVCSSNKGKQCVLHCLIRWLCSALSAFLISVYVSVGVAVELDGS